VYFGVESPSLALAARAKSFCRRRRQTAVVGKVEIDEARGDEQSTINPLGRIHSNREENCPNKRSHCTLHRSLCP
jgi:hypothetical protein